MKSRERRRCYRSVFIISAGGFSQINRIGGCVCVCVCVWVCIREVRHMSKHWGSQAGTMHVGSQPVANAHSHTHIPSQNTLSAAGVGILSHQKWRLRPDSTKSRGQPLDRFPIPNQRLKQDRVADNPPSSSSSNCAPSVLVLPRPQPCPLTCDAHYFSWSFHPFIPFSYSSVSSLHCLLLYDPSVSMPGSAPFQLCSPLSQSCFSFITFNAICHSIL